MGMAKPAYNAIKRNCGEEGKSIVFVADRKQTRITALDFLSFANCEENPHFLLPAPVSEEVKAKLSEKALLACLDFGVGFIHDGMSDREISLIKQLYCESKIRLLVVSH